MKTTYITCTKTRKTGRGWSAESKGTKEGDKNVDVHGGWSMQDLQSEVKNVGLYLNGHVSNWWTGGQGRGGPKQGGEI